MSEAALYTITKALAERMRSREVPGTVFFGTERFGVENPRAPRVQVIYQEGPTTDTFTEPGTLNNPKLGRVWAKVYGASITVGGKSTKSGAREQDHKAAVEALVDVVLGELLVVAHAAGQGVHNVRGGFQGPADPEKPMQDSALYTLQLSLSRGVFGRDALVATGIVADNTVTVHGNVDEIATAGD